MFQYQLILSYDGTDYFGWQKTKTGPSIQETLEQAIAQIGELAPPPEAASRTDRGVHARGQSVAIILKKNWKEELLQKALNSRLPLAIRVISVKAVALDFHPTLLAVEKQYHYYCCLETVQDPTQRLYSWHLYKPLSLDKMKEAAELLLGSHDFTALANAPKDNPLCTLNEIKMIPLAHSRLKFCIRGNRFLYNMARNIVGILVAVGREKLPAKKVKEILMSRDRKTAPMTAPAHGLILHKIWYN